MENWEHKLEELMESNARLRRLTLSEDLMVKLRDRFIIKVV